MRDVVVVGAGHNGLVAACYLARAGLDVEVVESRTVPGGAVSTVERWPGHRVDAGSVAHVLLRHTGIVEDLRLDRYGLRYLDLDPWGFAPWGRGGEQEAVTFHRDLDPTWTSIAKACGERDADAYADLVATWTPRAGALLAAFARPPTAPALGRLGVSLGRAPGGRLPGAAVARDLLAPADHELDRRFGDERLRATLGWLVAQSGSPTSEPGTAAHLMWLALMHLVPPGRPAGGTGRLAEALVACVRAHGGTVRLGDGARAIGTRGGRVAFVDTAGGDRLDARAVLAATHVRTTFDLLGPDALPGDGWSDAVAALRVGPGIGLVLRVLADAPPPYPAADPDGSSWFGMQLPVADRADLHLAYGRMRAGLMPDRPPLLVLTPTAADPTLSPDGTHHVTVWAQWYPRHLAGGLDWDDVGAAEADRVVTALDDVAPGFAGSVRAVHIQTPLDLERELGLVGGNVMHLDMGLDAMFTGRPLPGWSGYRTPLPGLYLTGASTHPGGGVSGLSGRSAAAVVLADLARTPTGRARRAVRRVVARLAAR